MQMAENLDALNGGGWGIYSPNHQTNCWGWAAVDRRTGQSGAPPHPVQSNQVVNKTLA
jgi:hypothetical protein